MRKRSYANELGVIARRTFIGSLIEIQNTVLGSYSYSLRHIISVKYYL